MSHLQMVYSELEERSTLLIHMHVYALAANHSSIVCIIDSLKKAMVLQLVNVPHFKALNLCIESIASERASKL